MYLLYPNLDFYSDSVGIPRSLLGSCSIWKRNWLAMRGVFASGLLRLSFQQRRFPLCMRGFRRWHRLRTPAVNALRRQELDHRQHIAAVLFERVHEVRPNQQRHGGLASWAESPHVWKVPAFFVPPDPPSSPWGPLDIPSYQACFREEVAVHPEKKKYRDLLTKIFYLYCPQCKKTTEGVFLLQRPSSFIKRLFKEPPRPAFVFLDDFRSLKMVLLGATTCAKVISENVGKEFFEQLGRDMESWFTNPVTFYLWIKIICNCSRR